MNARPKLTIELTPADRLLEGVSAALLILLWAGTLLFYSRLPEQIPTHFNAAGEADGFGSRQGIFALPAVATIIYIGMTLINRFPHLYNYPMQVTVENAARLYASATRLIRVLKLSVVIIFGSIVFLTYRSALTEAKGLGSWFLPLVLAVTLLPTLVFIVKAFRKPRTS
jgi:uncharacterized membrane protein